MIGLKDLVTIGCCLRLSIVTPVVKIIKLFSLSSTHFKHCQPSLIFLSKARSLPLNGMAIKSAKIG